MNNQKGRERGTYWANRVDVQALLKLQVVYQKLHRAELNSVTATSEVRINNQFSLQQMLKSLQNSHSSFISKMVRLLLCRIPEI